MEVTQYGISLELPTGWEGTIFVLRDQVDLGAISRPVVHAGNFPLPSDRSTYGSATRMKMSPGDLFLVLAEHDPQQAWIPGIMSMEDASHLVATDFALAGHDMALSGQLGMQKFFQHEGRSFALYAVITDTDEFETQLGDLNSVLASLAIGPPDESYYYTPEVEES
jgi:hypothetical protein